jgi:AraC-like DNA-binding protein
MIGGNCMQHKIKKYPVHHPLLKRYIKFFWEFRGENMYLNHKFIPQRNINVRFNLSETPHILSLNGNDQLLENVHFFGLQDHFTSAYLKLTGNVHTFGICFFPDGFYPFIKVPVSEFKNKLLGAFEVGFKLLHSLSERLKEAPDTATRLDILENELVILLINQKDSSDEFRKIFNSLKNGDNPVQIAEFCRHNNIGLRKLERLYNKHIGVSANTYNTLNRFHSSMNRLLYKDFSKFSDLAYDYGYFDQMHFIKEFKRFTGNTPKNFVTQNDSMLQIGKLT